MSEKLLPGMMFKGNKKELNKTLKDMVKFFCEKGHQTELIFDSFIDDFAGENFIPCEIECPPKEWEKL